MPYYVQGVSRDKIRSISEPTRGYVEYNTDYLVDHDKYCRLMREEDRPFAVRLEVPFPYLSLTNGPYGTLMAMSGDGEHWVKAEFPHVEMGYLIGCMQDGHMEVDEDNILLNITNYSMNYVVGHVIDFWDPAIKADEKGLGYKVVAENSEAFMYRWADTSVDDMLKHLNKKTGVLR